MGSAQNIRRSNPTNVVQNGLAWRESGSGEPIVFLHGLGGSQRAWGPQFRGLQDSFRCAAWDMPGYGDSVPLPKMDFESLADAVARWLDELGLNKATVVGLSLGGMVAQHFAIKHPDRVQRLILVDTSPAFGADGTAVNDWLDARLGTFADGQTPADIAADVLGPISGPNLTKDRLAELVTAFSHIGTDAFEAACQCLITHDVRNQLHLIAAPTLVIVGELDEETPLAYSEALAAGVPNSDLEIVAGAGHLTPTEQPEIFNQLIKEFAA